MGLVRLHAKDWGIDPNRVGILGFSAGGHLSATTSTNFDRRNYEPIDDVDKQREMMTEVLEIAAEQFYRIGISLDMGQFGVVKNNYYNVPLAMPESWNYPDPFPTNTSTYWIGPE